ncbi:MAG: aldehyde dehydrogenase family protein, partial [Planctomycetota bacterium]
MSQLISISPWNPQDRVFTGETANSTAIEIALAAMSSAFPTWSCATDRCERLRAFAQTLTGARADVVALLVREAGKTRADAE